MYYFALHKYVFDALRTDVNIFDHLVEFVFIPPRAMDFAITANNCFFLCHFGCRFRALNTTWRTLFPNPCRNVITRRITNYEMAILVERLRLLHAELSDLLRTFNRSYGPIILALFSFSLLDFSFDLYYIMFFNNNTMRIALCFQYFQNLLFFTSILWAASWTNDTVINNN